MGSKETEPLYYAIVRLFTDERARDAEDVLDELAPAYGGQRLFTRKGVDEALATAKENGLLDETAYRLDDRDELCVSYKITDFGSEMIRKYT